MRPLFALSALLILASTGPTMARDYPWCARLKGFSVTGDCSFDSRDQCMASVSGQKGDCAPNPWLAYNQDRRGNRRPAGWDNRW